MGFWDWWWRPTKHWYALGIDDPERGQEVRGPRYTTDSDATEWQMNEQEWRWGATVTRYRWTGSYWSRA